MSGADPHDPAAAQTVSDRVTTPSSPATFDAFGEQDTSAAPVPAAEPTELEPLTIVGVLGEGGMGTVHEAREPRLLRTVAVKSAREPRFAALLEREALVLSALEHPNIVPVYALHPGPRIVLRKIGGTTWDVLIHDPAAARVAARGEDVLSFQVRVLMAVCDAIAHGHSQRILHRDLKPENVMVGEHGQIYVLDWGLAVSLDPDDERPIPKARDQKRIAGTPRYMAPEQALAEELSERTDVYGLGAILHEILTLEPRNPGVDGTAQLESARTPMPVEYSAEVDELLGALANEMTATSPDERPATASAVRQRLVEWQQFRVSIDLTRRAKEQIKIARRARQASGDLVLVLDLLGEAIVALRQALDLWPGNRRAEETLQRVLLQAFDVQLGLQNFELAEALLGEMDAPEGPGEQLAQARVAAAREVEDLEELRNRAQDESILVDKPTRVFVGVVGTVVVGGMCLALAAVDRLAGPIGYGFALPGVAVFAAVFLAFVVAQLMTGNLRSRRIAWQFASMVVTVSAHWVAAALMDLPIPVALAWNCLLVAGLLGAAGRASDDRASSFAALPYALGAAAILLLPGLGWVIFALANASSYLIWTALHGFVRDTVRPS